jgi:hypothetical protein
VEFQEASCPGLLNFVLIVRRVTWSVVGELDPLVRTRALRRRKRSVCGIFFFLKCLVAASSRGRGM